MIIMPETYGPCNAITVWDEPDAQGYRGEAVFNTKDAGLITCKLPDTDTTSHLAMVAVLSNYVVQYGNQVAYNSQPWVKIVYANKPNNIKELDRVKIHWALHIQPP